MNGLVQLESLGQRFEIVRDQLFTGGQTVSVWFAPTSGRRPRVTKCAAAANPTGPASVFSSLAEEGRAGIPAAHGDDNIGNANVFRSEKRGAVVRDVDADSGHGRDYSGVERICRLAAGRPDSDEIPAT
jgi:hypothetical protein